MAAGPAAPATADDPGDAGRCYVATAGHREPLLSKVAAVDADSITRQGEQRAAFGLPRIDTDSWERARARRAAERATVGGDAPGSDRAGVDRQAITDVATVFGSDTRLWTDEILSRLASVDQRYAGWSADELASLLRPLGVAPRSVRINTITRKGYYRDELVSAFEAWKSGDRRW